MGTKRNLVLQSSVSKFILSCQGRKARKVIKSQRKGKGIKIFLERCHHLQKQDDVKYQENKCKLTGLDRGENNGIMAHYNFRFEKQLGIKHFDMRRIPCYCDLCLEKLKLPWDLTKDSFNQPRYSQNKHCHFGDIFLGLNNWKVVQIFGTEVDG